MTSAQEDQPRLRPGLSLETRSVIDVFTEVMKRGPIARIDVARRTGLSQSAVTKAMAPLIGRGLLFTDGNAQVSAPGRPPQPISVKEEAQLVLGLVLRADEIFGVATTIRANVLHSVRRPLHSPSVSAAADGIAAVVESLRSRLGDYDVDRWQREFLAALRGDDDIMALLGTQPSGRSKKPELAFPERRPA